MPKRKAPSSKSYLAHPAKARRLRGLEPSSVATSAGNNATTNFTAAQMALKSCRPHAHPPALVAVATLGETRAEVDEMVVELGRRALANPAFGQLYRDVNAGTASPDQVRGYNVHAHEVKIALDMRKRQQSASQPRLPDTAGDVTICDTVQSIIRIPPSTAKELVKLGDPMRTSQWLRLCFEADPASGVTHFAFWQAFACTFSSLETSGTRPNLGTFVGILHDTFPGVKTRAVNSKNAIIGIRPKAEPERQHSALQTHLSGPAHQMKTCDDVETIIRISPRSAKELMMCEERARTSQWLRFCFEADPLTRVTERVLRLAFLGTFSPHETPRRRLSLVSLLGILCSTFPDATVQLVDSKNIIVGIRPKAKASSVATVQEPLIARIEPPLDCEPTYAGPIIIPAEEAAELAARASRDPELDLLVKNVNAKNATLEEIKRFNAHLKEIQLSLQIQKRQKAAETRPHAVSSQGITQVPPTLHRGPAVIGSTCISSETATELAKRVSRNPELYLLVKNVMAKKATPEEIKRFKAYIHEIELTLKIPKVLGTAETRPPAESSQARPTNATPYAQPAVEPRQLVVGRMLNQMRLPSGHYRPRPKHKSHPDSGVGANFHSVPYPLSLLPFKSWQALHNENTKGVVCSSCAQPRPVTPHQRKLFLVAERLTWENQSVSTANRNKNEEALWAVNAELEIYEPAVEDEEVVVSGRQSKGDVWYPFANEDEAEVVIRIVERAGLLSERSWSLWKMKLDESHQERSEESALQNQAGEAPSAPGRPPRGEISPNSRSNSSTAHTANAKGKQRAIWQVTDPFTHSPKPALPTPPSSAAIEQKGGAVSAAQSKIQTLQDFYALLDKLERTSPMAARFLEAYAERLRNEVCNDCWFKHNVLDEEELEDEHRLASRPVWSEASTAALFSR